MGKASLKRWVLRAGLKEDRVVYCHDAFIGYTLSINIKYTLLLLQISLVVSKYPSSLTIFNIKNNYICICS